MFKKLKSIFIVDDEKAGKDAAGKNPPVKKGSTSSKTTKASGAGRNTSGKVSQKFIDVLLKSLAEANLEGFDYFEYKESLKSLEKMSMNEETRYQSAFAMARTMGATPGSLDTSARHYLKVLKNEFAKFEEVVKQQEARQIGDNQNRVSQLTKVIEEKKAAIQRMNLEIQKHEKEMTAIKKKVDTSAVKVEKTRNDFIASYNALFQQISNDVDRMKKYLK